MARMDSGGGDSGGGGDGSVGRGVGGSVDQTHRVTLARFVADMGLQSLLALTSGVGLFGSSRSSSILNGWQAIIEELLLAPTPCASKAASHGAAGAGAGAGPCCAACRCTASKYDLDEA
ncbi:uncharacterized protein PV09_01205 [Verruconis gallopava]|uniref:Uncharacterized protein n=1 Tax=Verruconis gallopava TaxID=253628 RepID=A0A0D1Z5N7_9PEZI|nr:uncharacterized protein PV09_01205 [Verruconis gallopava]KIW08287.1 hypothetical protein PV09_01205 [Verruconis gallopava]